MNDFTWEERFKYYPLPQSKSRIEFYLKSIFLQPSEKAQNIYFFSRLISLHPVQLDIMTSWTSITDGRQLHHAKAFSVETCKGTIRYNILAKKS